MLQIPHYPKATVNRLHGNDKSIRGPRHAFLKAAFLNFTLLQLLFLGLFCYIFASLFQQAGHVHNLNVLYVDYDGGVVGTSIRDAYASLKGDGFPTLQEHSSDKFPTVKHMREEVCRARYWGAIYTTAEASTRLSAALEGGDAATTYNRTDVLSFIWNEARYSAVIDSTVAAGFKTLSDTARIAYTTRNGSSAVGLLSPNNSAYETSISIFANPWTLTNDNIQPTSQGSRLIYNTLVIILILIQEFFYLGTINGLYVQFKIYARLYPHRIIVYRNMISLSYTFVGSLCVTGAIWAFRAGWHVNANQFALTWASLWLFAHANFLWLDVFTVWVPMQYVPMSLITWIVFNVTSILIPFELSPAFYRWGYAMPAHEVFNLLIDIWSRGCNPQVYHALPVLFALEITALVLSALGVYRRCHYAMIAEQAQEQTFQERLDAALEFERKRDEEREKIEEGGQEPDEISRAQTLERDRETLADAIRKEETQLERQKSKACGFGPSFDLAFKDGEAA